MSTAQTNVTVNMISDFICPWCLIGEKRLQDAIASLPDDITVSVRFHPFELNPDMQKEGMDRKIYRSLKFGSWDRSQKLDAGTVAAGQPDGVTFNYDAIMKTPNTFAAHKLTQWAAAQSEDVDIAPRVLRAYFVEGRDIGDPTVLASIAGEAGLDQEAAAAYITNPETDDDTRQVLRSIIQDGVGGVPQFEIGGSIVRGAQSAETLAAEIKAAAEQARQSALQEV